MAEDQDKSQKTEEPSQKRLDEAARKGNVITSKEVTTFVLIFSITIFITNILPHMARSLAVSLQKYIILIEKLEEINSKIVLKIGAMVLADLAFYSLIPLSFCIVAIIFGNTIQHGIILSSESMMPDPSRISMIKGWGRLFSRRNVIEMIKGLVKVTIISFVSYLAIRSEATKVQNLFYLGVFGGFNVMLSLITKVLIYICIVLSILAVLDYFYQRMEYMESMKMTKQEVKEEHKEAEGSPDIKAKIRAIRAQRARRRIITLVPKADVIITNPTHFSIALQYDGDLMHAPKLVAKGQDKMAFQIREIAKKHKIPIVQNPPLARSIYDTVDFDEFIQFEHYEAVAQIINKVMKVKGKKF